MIVNPDDPDGGCFDMEPLPGLLRRHPRTNFLVDEAFIGLAGQPVASCVTRHDDLLVTRTISKAHSLAGFRVGYANLPERLADDLNAHNDAIATQLAGRRTLVKPLRDRVLGHGFMRGTTALPDDNRRFIGALDAEWVEAARGFEWHLALEQRPRGSPGLA